MAQNVNSQPPTGIFAEPTVHIEPNHTSYKRFTITLSSSVERVGVGGEGGGRTYLMVGKTAEGNGDTTLSRGGGGGLLIHRLCFPRQTHEMTMSNGSGKIGATLGQWVVKNVLMIAA